MEIIQGEPLILRGLDSYGDGWNKVSTSFRDVFIYNVPIYQNAGSMEGIRGAAFVFDLGDLCIAHLGDLSQPLTPQQLKMFGKVDVALTPIGGWRTMAPDLARTVLTQLKRYFDSSRCADETHSKPHPAMLQELMQELAVEPEATLMIGDTAHDLQMAMSAGVPALAVSYGAHPRDSLTEFNPLACIDTPQDLAPWLAMNG